MAMEANYWPRWVRDMWPEWLEGIGYPKAGVGDLEDLKFALGIGQDGRWLGFIKPGWYYNQTIEQYNYVKVGSTQVTNLYGASGTVTASISFRPSWGPILVQGVADDASGSNDGPYREHHNSFYPGYQLTFSAQSSSVIVATLPSSCILVGLRNLTNLPMGSVAGSSSILNEKQYYYDPNTNKVYIKPKAPTNLNQSVWADLLYTYPLLRFREVVISETNASGYSIVKPSYREIQDVRAFRGSYTTLTTGFHASGSLTHTLSGVYAGDWVILDYWICKSFVLQDHRTLKYFVGGPLSSAYQDVFKIYYETSIPDIQPNITINVPSSSVYNAFNVNPLYEFGYRSGYLFHGQPASSINSYWVPSTIEIYLDKTEVCKDWAEPLKIRISISGDNGLPLPYYPITVSVNGGSALIKSPSGMTSGRGDMHYLVRPHATAATSSITISASCGSLTASAIASVVTSAVLITGTKWYDGFVHVVVTNDKTGRGAYRTFTTATTADGLPRNNQVYLTSNLTSEFHSGSNKTLTQKIDVTSSVGIPNIQALSELGYVPQPNDSLFGYSNTANSQIIKGESNGL